MQAQTGRRPPCARAANAPPPSRTAIRRSMTHRVLSRGSNLHAHRSPGDRRVLDVRKRAYLVYDRMDFTVRRHHGQNSAPWCDGGEEPSMRTSSRRRPVHAGPIAHHHRVLPAAEQRCTRTRLINLKGVEGQRSRREGYIARGQRSASVVSEAAAGTTGSAANRASSAWPLATCCPRWVADIIAIRQVNRSGESVTTTAAFRGGARRAPRRPRRYPSARRLMPTSGVRSASSAALEKSWRTSPG